MVQVTPQQLRDFAAMLKPNDFTTVCDALPGFNLHGGMPDSDKPNGLLQQWAPQLAGFGHDLARGIDAFGTVSRNAADRFDATDRGAAGRFEVNDRDARDIIATELNPVRVRDWTDGDGLPPIAPPPAPPSVSNPPMPKPDPHVRILAPGEFGTSGGSTQPTA
ncbi:hypothetical protein [Kribbella solani]|uniref:Uncharacterized protein n=1 Tax=Kribbella solani TaxID=236067 RepID=A0A841DWM7_9ACTN|nr:hypothetical protein [Kribbella solani]MBB5981166.1 hypothetical protein [Kribbella solani]